MPNFRNELQIVTDELDIDLHPQLVETLRTKYNHGVLLEQQFSNGDFFVNSNCFMYALGVHQNSKIINILSNGGPVFGSDFIIYLIDKEIFEQNNKGKMIIYFNNEKPVHAGLQLNNEVVKSKWGCGHIWQHGPLEVPSSYGDDYKKFISATPQVIEKEFVIFSSA